MKTNIFDKNNIETSAKEYMLNTFGAKINTPSQCSHSTLDKYYSFIAGINWVKQQMESQNIEFIYTYTRERLENMVYNMNTELNKS